MYTFGGVISVQAEVVEDGKAEEFTFIDSSNSFPKNLFFT